MAVKIRLRRISIESSLQIPDPQETEDVSKRSELMIQQKIQANIM